MLQLSPIYVNTIFARKITILKLNRKCSIGSCMIAGLSLSAGCLPAKFSGWEKGHRRLNLAGEHLVRALNSSLVTHLFDLESYILSQKVE